MTVTRLRQATRVRRAFTLLELTIVVGVIILLLGLVLAVSTVIVAKSEERTTRNTLTQLDLAMKEWERQVDHPVSFQNQTSETGIWDVPFNPDIASFSGTAEGQFPAPYNTKLEDQRTLWLLNLISQQATVRDILAKLPETVFRRVQKPGVGATIIYINAREVRDAWDLPIHAIFPGRTWQQGDSGAADLDGTIQTVSESFPGHGTCRNRQVLFVSAGPDGKFETIADNIYSYGQEGQ